MTQTTIIIIVIVSVVLFLALVGVIVYFMFFGRRRLKKQAEELLEKYEYSHGMLFGQDAQYLKRLQAIADCNLLYAQVYALWEKRFREIRDIGDSSAKSCTVTISDYIADKRWGDLKAYLPQAKKTILEFANNVDELSEGLKNKFQQEEAVKSLLNGEREKSRAVRASYLASKDDLALVSETFERFFSKVNNLFLTAEGHIQNARYEEAREVLQDEIDPVLANMQEVIKVLPGVCLNLTAVLPDKLLSLENRYEVMLADGYPLSHIVSRQELDSKKTSLDHLAKRTAVLELKGIKESIQEMEDTFDSYTERFDKEVEAREKFEADNEKVYEQQLALENDFIELSHSLPNVRKIYALGEKQQDDLVEIQGHINRASSAKRILDNSIHSSTRVAYSLLLERMEALEEQRSAAQTAIDAFRTYIMSLKSDSEAAANLLKDTYAKLKKEEGVLRAIEVPVFEARYTERISACYNEIDTLYTLLKTLPINVEKVNELARDLSSASASLFAEIEDGAKKAKESEKALLFANRYRGSSAVNGALLQAETLFNNGSFEECYNLVNTAIADSSRG